MTRWERKEADLNVVSDLLRTSGALSTAEVAERLEISYERARQRLLLLAKLGRVQCRGKYRQPGGQRSRAHFFWGTPSLPRTGPWSTFGPEGKNWRRSHAGAWVNCPCGEALPLGVMRRQTSCWRCGREYLLVVIMKTR
jgi:hypothetical protein